MIWFTADFHLSHANTIKHCHRPFKDVEIMDKTILDNLRASVKPNDVLYFLGDLTFREEIALQFFELFKDIEIHYITSNHDYKRVIKIAKEHCSSVSEIKDIKIEGQSITLCHYAMRVWNKSHFNAWLLYGYSHGTLTPIGKKHDVGVDSNNLSPLSFEKLKQIMDQKDSNANFIPPERRNR
ncbi:MAG: metallophosphoesterase family protein [Promethearchaeota archaeon]